MFCGHWRGRNVHVLVGADNRLGKCFGKWSLDNERNTSVGCQAVLWWWWEDIIFDVDSPLLSIQTNHKHKANKNWTSWAAEWKEKRITVGLGSGRHQCTRDMAVFIQQKRWCGRQADQLSFADSLRGGDSRHASKCTSIRSPICSTVLHVWRPCQQRRGRNFTRKSIRQYTMKTLSRYSSSKRFVFLSFLLFVLSHRKFIEVDWTLSLPNSHWLTNERSQLRDCASVALQTKQQETKKKGKNFGISCGGRKWLTEGGEEKENKKNPLNKKSVHPRNWINKKRIGVRNENIQPQSRQQRSETVELH